MWLWQQQEWLWQEQEQCGSGSSNLSARLDI